jgi:hypothetical protein
MPPYKNLVPMKSHGIMVEDERQKETERYERQLEIESAREREAHAANLAAGRRSLTDRLRDLFRRPDA